EFRADAVGDIGPAANAQELKKRQPCSSIVARRQDFFIYQLGVIENPQAEVKRRPRIRGAHLEQKPESPQGFFRPPRAQVMIAGEPMEPRGHGTQVQSTYEGTVGAGRVAGPLAS